MPTFVNLIVILFLSRTFFTLLKDYKARYLGINSVDPDGIKDARVDMTVLNGEIVWGG